MAFSLSTTARDAMAGALNTTLGTGCKLEVWTTAYGTLLATWTWTGNFATGTNPLNALTPASISVSPVANGVAAIARFTTSGGTPHLQDLVVATSGGDVNISNTTLSTTNPVSFVSYSLTVPA